MLRHHRTAASACKQPAPAAAATTVRAAVRTALLRLSAAGAGCCGITELLKLHAYLLLEFDRVLLLDTDTIILRSIDHVFERRHLVHSTA